MAALCIWKAVLTLATAGILVLLARPIVAAQGPWKQIAKGKLDNIKSNGRQSSLQSSQQGFSSSPGAPEYTEAEPAGAPISTPALQNPTDPWGQLSSLNVNPDTILNINGAASSIEQSVTELIAMGLQYTANIEDMTHIGTVALTPGIQRPNGNGNSQFVNLELSDFTVKANLNGTADGFGRIAYSWQNGTVVYQLPFSAPMVSRAVLEERLHLVKLIDASSTAAFLLNQTAPTVEIFKNQLANLNISETVENVTLVSVDISGIPGISTLFPCFAGVPTKTSVYVVTFVGEPGTAAFFFSPTDWTVYQNVDTDACIVWALHNSTSTYPCPAYNGVPCLVHRGFQEAFDSVRDQLVPTWRSISNPEAPSKPTKIICSGHSLGASLAALCAPHMKAIVPNASVVYFGSGSPKTGNDAFVQYLTTSTSQSTSLINSCDPIPAIPPTIITLYVEVPEAIWLIRTNTSNETSYIAFAHPRPPGVCWNYTYADHKTPAYVSAMESAIRNAIA